MDANQAKITERIRVAEAELNRAIADWRKTIAAARESTTRFTEEVRAQHRKLRRNLWEHIRSVGFLFWLTAPIIYAMIVPLVFIDLCATLYQFTCFPVYGIERVRRSDYVIIDRHRLSYLNAIEKLNCVFCGYANGVIAYVRELASRTEQYFCPIKHALSVPGTHTRYSRFVAYGDAAEYRSQREQLRKTASEL
jgi:hypothetical protein